VDELTLGTRHPGEVRMRDLTEDDAAELAAHIASDLPRLAQFLAWPERTVTPDGARAFVGPYVRAEGGRRLIAGLWADGALVGGVVLFAHEPAAGLIELGCWGLGSVEGLGVVRAACVEALRLARSWDVERVQWQCDPANTRSAGLALRLGFRHEGTLRSAYPLRGERRDTAVYGLVGPEIDAALTSSQLPPRSGWEKRTQRGQRDRYLPSS
jgi:RimJ/RimL family protein N-acetyltransferase